MQTQNYQLSNSQPQNTNQAQFLSNNRFKLVKDQQKLSFLMSFMRLFKISDQVFKSLEKHKDEEKLAKIFEQFYSKSLKKVEFQQEIVTLHLKKNRNKSHSTKDYSQSFHCLGNEFHHQISTFFQYIHNQQKQYQTLKNQLIEQPISEICLKNIQTKIKNKKFIICVTKKGKFCPFIEQIIISKSFLLALGHQQQQMKMDFLKYKHVFVEIIDKAFYKELCQGFKKKIKKVGDSQEFQQLAAENQAFKNSLIQFEAFVYKKQNTQGGKAQSKLKSSIQVYKPHPQIMVMQFEIKEEHAVQMIQTESVDSSLKRFIEQKIVKQQLSCLNSIAKCKNCNISS